jgi:DNA replication protein DnaC
MITSQVPVEK